MSKTFNGVFKDHLALSGDSIQNTLVKGINPFSHMGNQLGKFPVAGVLLEELTDGYGNSILKPVEANTVVVGGAIHALEKVTGVAATFEPTTLNTILGINPTVTGTFDKANVLLYACGTGGCGLEYGSVVAPDIKQRDIMGMVPMRYGANVTGDDAAKYFMKKQNADNLTYSWYCKEFDGPPTLHTQWKNAVDPDSDGTEITSDIHDSKNTEGIESYAEFKISLNTNDIYEYFAATNQLNMARYNTIGFYTGEKRTIEGKTDYVNVRLFSLVTFNNRDVSMKTTASYRYRIYSLI